MAKGMGLASDDGVKGIAFRAFGKRYFAGIDIHVFAGGATEDVGFYGFGAPVSAPAVAPAEEQEQGELHAEGDEEEVLEASGDHGRTSAGWK
jgi:hypothetical protein